MNERNVYIAPLGICMHHVVAIILLSLSALGYAGEDKIRACYTQWPPFSYEEGGEAKGLSIDIYREAAKRAGLALSFHRLPWKRCKGELISRRFDAAVDGGPGIPFSLSSEQAPIVWGQLFWVSIDSPVTQFNGYSQFERRRVGFTRGYTYPNDFYAFSGFEEKRAVSDDLMGLKMLHSGRLDAYFGDLINNRYLVEKHRLNLKPIYPFYAVRRLTLIFSKAKTEQDQRFKTAVKQMFEDGSIDALYNRHLGLSYRQATHQTEREPADIESK